MTKIQPNEIINVIASEQKYTQQIVKDTLRTLGYTEAADNFHHLAYEFVALSSQTARELGVDTSDNRSVYHMSGRKGIGVSSRQLFDLMVEKIKETKFDKSARRNQVKRATPEKIAVGAIRYYLTKFNYSTLIVFDFDEALSLKGDTGPYLQYTHARAAGIIDKAGVEQLPIISISDYPLKLTDSEWKLIFLMVRFSEVIEDVANTYDVTILTSYANQLATSFNYFYEKNPVLKVETTELKKQRLMIVVCFKQVMANVLDTLGISAPEAM